MHSNTHNEIKSSFAIYFCLIVVKSNTAFFLPLFFYESVMTLKFCSKGFKVSITDGIKLLPFSK
jgi:hypothetical protein